MIEGKTWPGRAAAAWAFVFAVPSFYWALGGTWGATTTVAPALVELARARVPWFVAVLWVTGVLKVVGGLLGLALARRRGGAWTQFLGWGAGVLLAWHGALFVVQGVLVETGVRGLDPELLPISRWYTFLWGPWFLLGGLAFLAAARAGLRSPRAAVAGGVGALVLSVAMLVAGVG